MAHQKALQHAATAHIDQAMFQTFDAPQDQSSTAPRIAQLRSLLKKTKLDAYLIPRADEHQGEYVPSCAERLRWLTGFSGSAGLAIVARTTAALFVDGRYTVQARNEVDTKIFTLPKAGPPNPITTWLIETLRPNSIVGFDPWLHTIRDIETLSRALAKHNIKLKSIARTNLVDKIWGKERPLPPRQAVIIHPLTYAGVSAADKLATIQSDLEADGQDAVVLTLPDSICWLFNIRGSDIAHNPVVLAFAIVHKRGKAELFIDPEKLSQVSRDHLKGTAKLRAPDNLRASIAKLKASDKKVRLDPATAAVWFSKRLSKNQIVRAPDPCLRRKAVKNATEILGARAAHARDGAAMVRFLAWLDREAPKGKLDEIDAATALENFRRETNALKDISFDTISGSGPNGAIVHYRVTERTNRRLRSGELYLLDSGAQYADGTTDITRTVAIGKPTAEMRNRFTRVLKGHIAIATARFPITARGIDLDPFARRALWQAGLDYDHGTGHGVGSYLSVHEGPASISRAGMVKLEPGMILSNEPGYYKEGHYGIRIENLVLVTKAETPKDGDRSMLGFETLTLAPIDQRLIDKDLLTPEEVSWLNTYHARVAKTLKSKLNAQDRAWLMNAISPL